MKLHTQRMFAILALAVLLLAPVGMAYAQVQVTSADPSSTVQGTTSLDVTVNGNGFDSTATVEFLVTGTTDPGGVTTYSYGQPRYGIHSGWYGGKVLTNGCKPGKGGGVRCDRTDMVTEIDPATSAETPLVRGFDPDGR